MTTPPSRSPAVPVRVPGAAEPDTAAALVRRVAESVDLLPALPPPDPSDRYHVRTLTALWLVGLGETSRRGYYLVLAGWLSWCAGHGVDPLAARRADVDAWKAAMTARRRGPGGAVSDAPAARATVAKRLAVVSSWYRYLAANEVPAGNPALATGRPTPPRYSPLPALAAGETATFLAWLLARAGRLGSEAAWRDAAHLHLMFATGLRVTAACLAQFEDLAFESGHRVLRYRKKSRGAGEDWDWVPLTRQLLDVLNRYWAVRAAREGVPVEQLAGYLFVSTPHPHQPARTGGVPLGQKHVHRRLRTLAQQAGVSTWRTITPHSARRTAGTLALANGATLAQVQDLLGHADPRTTRRYDDTRHRLDTSPVWAIADALSASSDP
jgi:integrase